METETNLISFWQALDRYTIVIPLYQRDYAQGREGEEELRRKFVARLLEALRNQSDRKVKLDYVFGVVADSKFYPLDGQQRLTTLWLLHWYVALKEGAKADEVGRLNKFSYETRTTSAEFCEHLAMTEGMSGNDIVQFVKDQTWYLGRYEKDPTVSGMLNTLKTIESCTKGDVDFGSYWDALKADDCPISFFVEKQDSDAGAEDLYLKMNSRGKKLTEFENFKADLIGCKGEDGKPIFGTDEAGLLDNEWTNIFWIYKREEDGEIDEIYFQFFKRYLLSYWITEKCAEARVDDIIHKDKNKPDNLFSHLHQGAGRYVSIEPYKPSIDRSMVTRLKSFFGAYAKWKDEIDSSVAPYWNSKCADYTLIPRYSVKNLNRVFDEKLYEGLPVIYAASRFLEKYCSKESHAEEFKRWMRFVWNLVDGSFAGNPDVMVGLLRLLKGITDCDFLDIDQMLVDDWKKYKESTGGIYAGLFNNARAAARTRALHGEIQKARLRVFQKKQNENGNEVYKWIDKLLSVETIGFLHGALEFLLPESLVDKYIREEESRKQIEDDFEAQIGHAREYFGSDGVKFAVQKSLAKAMIKGIDHFWQIEEDGISKEVSDGFYDNEYLCRTDKNAWRERIFRNPVTARALAYALKAENLDIVEYTSFQDVDQSNQEAAENLRRGLLDSGILDIADVVGPYDRSSWRFKAYKDETISFYRARGSGCRRESPRYYLDSNPIGEFLGCCRNSLLFTDAFMVDEEDRVKDKNVCAPKDHWSVHFTFSNNKFIWGRNNIISLLGEGGNVISSGKYQFEKHSTGEEFKKLLKEVVENVRDE